MSPELEELNLEILVRLVEIEELQRTIKDIDAMLIKEASEENKLFWQETIDRYQKLLGQLKIRLEAYFNEEARFEEPPSLSYRRLYKNLKSAI